jgi:hypothetical protein
MSAELGRSTGVRGRVAACVVALTVAGCAVPIKVNHDFDKAADFSKYHTYAWREGTGTTSSLVQKRIVAAVDSQLAAKGLSKDESNPDLLVYTHVRLDERTQAYTYSTGWGYGWGWYGGMGSTQTTVEQIPVGMLLVDLVDAQRKELVWRGSATSDIDSEASAEKKEARINEALTKMFVNYPPGAAK